MSAGIAAGLLLAAVPSAAARPDSGGASAARVSVQLLALDDLHGVLEPPPPGRGRIESVDVGGVEYLATHIARLRAGNRNTLVVGAGDLVGDSPFLSSLFHDEPTIESLNLLGLQVSSAGNHEFDEGAAELLRLQRGGCHPEGCGDGDGFAGARFPYLAGNVHVVPTPAARRAHLRALSRARRCTRSPRNKSCRGKQPPLARTLLPPYQIRRVGGVRIGLVGQTPESTPPGLLQIPGLDFTDEAFAANRSVRELKRRGVETIVLLLHLGGYNPGSYNGCPRISGPVVRLLPRLSDEIDVVLSAHSHDAYNCTLDGKLVTSADSYGKVLTQVRLVIDSRSSEVISKSATNRLVTRDVPKDPAQTRLIARYRAIAAPLANRVVGSIMATIGLVRSASGETPLGDLVADSQLATTRAPDRGAAQIAFVDPGELEATLSRPQSSAGEARGEVTYEEAFAVVPINERLVTMTLTGAQIDTLLEQQFSGLNASRPRVLQVSNGFTYTYDLRRPRSDRVSAADIRLNGVPIDPRGTYRVTVMSTLASGGRGFSVLAAGRDRVVGPGSVDALADYLVRNSPLAPPPPTRIVKAG